MENLYKKSVVLSECQKKKIIQKKKNKTLKSKTNKLKENKWKVLTYNESS